MNNKNRQSVDFNIKASWLAISKMYNFLGSEHDITHSTGFVLLNIDQDNGTPATKIAPLMGMEARSLSRMLKNMEEDGIIYRRQDEYDKRKVIICLTEKGQKQREVARRVVREFNGKVRELVTPEEMQTFLSVIRRITDIAENFRIGEGEKFEDSNKNTDFEGTEMLPFEI